MEDTSNEVKPKRYLFKLCLFLTIIYPFIIFFILFINLYHTPPSPELGLNGIGDFLAGSFSPLAFAWLVYGYLMQSRELRENTHESREAHKLSREQLRFHKRLNREERLREFNVNQPHFSVMAAFLDGQPILKLRIDNSGSKVTNFLIYSPNKFNVAEDVFLKYPALNVLDENSPYHLDLDYFDEILEDRKIITYPITFYDGLRQLQKTELRVAHIKTEHGWDTICKIDPTQKGLINGY